MAWKHDLSPVEYLEQRLRYYKRKQTWAKNLIVTAVVNNRVVFKVKKPHNYKLSLVKKYIKRMDERVDEFQSAIAATKKLFNSQTRLPANDE